jgi:hypothetical protein
MDTDPLELIKTVESGKCATHLLEHVRTKLVVNTNRAYYYKAGEDHVLLSGLLPRLKSTFWPHSNAYKQMAGGGGGAGIQKRSKRRKGGGKYGGRIKGTEVHKQLRDFVVLDKKNFKKNHKKLHPYCQRILSTIVNDMKWQPFLPEFDIYAEELRIGTSVDMICLDEKGHLILLEFKTGYKDYFENDDGTMMLRSLSGMRNTPLNQATCQLVSAAMILNRKYQIPLSFMHLYVIRVDDEVVELNPIQNKFTTIIGPHIYKDLLTP